MKVERSRTTWETIEAGLGSAGRIRMLRTMIGKPNDYFTKYALEKATGLKPLDVRNGLKVLVELGWVEEHPCDPKTYRINMENETVKLIADFFKKLKSPWRGISSRP
jgi:hypothetical protein